MVDVIGPLFPTLPSVFDCLISLLFHQHETVYLLKVHVLLILPIMLPPECLRSCQSQLSVHAYFQRSPLDYLTTTKRLVNI